jgi:hypothetical protein
VPRRRSPSTAGHSEATQRGAPSAAKRPPAIRQKLTTPIWWGPKSSAGIVFGPPRLERTRRLSCSFSSDARLFRKKPSGLIQLGNEFSNGARRRFIALQELFLGLTPTIGILVGKFWLQNGKNATFDGISHSTSPRDPVVYDVHEQIFSLPPYGGCPNSSALATYWQRRLGVRRHYLPARPGGMVRKPMSEAAVSDDN